MNLGDKEIKTAALQQPWRELALFYRFTAKDAQKALYRVLQMQFFENRQEKKRQEVENFFLRLPFTLSPTEEEEGWGQKEKKNL